MLHAIGQCLIRTGVATIAPRAELGFALATRLIADRGRRLSRRYLSALFWPDVHEQKTAHSLSEALHRLRARGLPIQTDSTQAVWLERDAATLDVDRIAEMPPATLVKCDFTILPGFEPRGTPALLDWVDEFRRQLTLQTVRNLGAAIARAEQDGDWSMALALAEQTLKLDADDPLALQTRAAAATKLSERRPLAGVSMNRAPALAADIAGARPVVHERAADTCELRSMPAPRQSGAFVGREVEMDVLRDAWESARRGHGRRLLVYGACGIGKTRLIRQFRSVVRQSGGVMADVYADPGDASRPLSSFLRLVPRLRSLPGAAAIAPDLRPHLDRLTEVHGANSPWPDPADTPYILSCVERAIDELIDSVADEQPLVIVIDNAQWIDAESRRLLDSASLTIASRAALIIAISCDRDDALLPPSCPSLVPLQVGPLADEAAGLLLRDRIHAADRTADDALVRWLVSAGEGNPLRLEEIAAHWLNGGAPFELPPTVSAVLRARIAELASIDRHVLQVVALLGQQATIARVQRIAALDQPALLDSVDSLSRSGLLDVDDGGVFPGGAEGARIRCRHDAVADAAVSQLSPAGCAVLHRAIALDLDRDASISADVLWDRVTHWSGGNEPTDSARLTITCVRHLAAVGLADAGAAACRQLLRDDLAAATRCQILAALVHALQQGWRWREVLDVADEMRRVASCAAPHDDVELCVLDARWQLQHAPEETLARAIHCASSPDASSAHRVGAAAIALKVATNAGRLGKLHEAFQAVSQCLSDPDVDPADRIMVAMMYHAVAGSLQLAAECAHDLIRRSGKLAEPARLRALVNAASALARAGECAEALQICEQAHRDASSRQLAAIAAAASNRAANIALGFADVESGRSWIERFAAHAAEDDCRQQRAILLGRARLAYHDGDLSLAERLLTLEDTPLWIGATPAFAAMALATAIAAAGEAGCCEDRMRSLLAVVMPLHRRLQGMGTHDFVACALASGYARIGECKRAETLMDSYLTRHRREPTPIPERFAAMLEQARLSASTTG